MCSKNKTLVTSCNQATHRHCHRGLRSHAGQTCTPLRSADEHVMHSGPRQAAPGLGGQTWRLGTLQRLGSLPALQHLEVEGVPAQVLRRLPTVPSLRGLALKASDCMAALLSFDQFVYV